MQFQRSSICDHESPGLHSYGTDATAIMADGQTMWEPQVEHITVAGVGTCTLAAGELNGDGYPELILSDGEVLHRVSGGAEVSLDAQPWVDGGGEELKSPQLNDLDGDGSLDLMVQGEGITVNQVSSGSTWVLHGPITAPISLLSSNATLYAGSPDQRLGEPHWTGTQLIGASWDGLWTPE